MSIAQPTFDTEGYPTDATLETISTWPFPFDGLMAYVRTAWQYANAGYWQQDGPRYRLSTGGWSGNESLITALQANGAFWLLSWQDSRRGGHYTLDLSWKDRLTRRQRTPR
jgi:hypothetical protein